MGNSTLKGIYIRNSEFLKHAGEHVGFKIVEETERQIPDHRRYMPISINGNTFANRMSAEHIIDFKKAK